MPELNLSPGVPPNATWVKIQYEIVPLKPGARLIARLWSGNIEEAIVIQGASGDAFVKLNKPQHLSYQRPVTVDLKLKIVAYKAAAE